MQRTDTFEKRPWCWERLKAGGEGDDRGWYGWMASPTQWTWIWVNSGSWRWTGKPGMLQSLGSKTVGHNCVTELNWSQLFFLSQLLHALDLLWTPSLFYLSVLYDYGPLGCSSLIYSTIHFPYFFFLDFRESTNKTQWIWKWPLTGT